MSIFKKIKQQLGIGTVKAKLQAPKSIAIDDFNENGITGKIALEAKSDQRVKSIKITLFEKRKVDGDADKGNSENYTSQTIGGVEASIIKSTTLSESFEIKQGETRTIDFTIEAPINKIRLGVSDFSFFSKGIYFEVVAVVNLDNVTLDPTAAQEIEFL